MSVVKAADVHNYLIALEGHLVMLDRLHDLIAIWQGKMDYVCIKRGIDLRTSDGVKKLRQEMHRMEGREPTAFNDVLLDNLNWAPWEMYLVLLDAVVEYYSSHILDKTPELAFSELSEFILEHEGLIAAMSPLRHAILHPYEIESQLTEFGEAIKVSQVDSYRFAQSLHRHMRGLFHFLFGVELCLSICEGNRAHGR